MHERVVPGHVLERGQRAHHGFGRLEATHVEPARVGSRGCDVVMMRTRRLDAGFRRVAGTTGLVSRMPEPGGPIVHRMLLGPEGKATFAQHGTERKRFERG